MRLQRKIIRKSFSLVEVLISLVLLGISIVPLLDGVLIQVRSYQKTDRQITSQIVAEEMFFHELAFLITCKYMSFNILDDGFTKQIPIDGGNSAITMFEVIDGKEEETPSGARLGQLTTYIETKTAKETLTDEIEQITPIQSVLIAFEKNI